MDISLCLDPGRAWSDVLELARRAEERGVDAIYVPDHFGEHREAWTLLSALAASTERVRLGPLVLSVTHRHVAVLRAMARTLHEVSHERLVLGLGAGWDEAEHRSLGLDFPSTGQRLDLLEEAARELAGSGPPLLIGEADPTARLAAYRRAGADELVVRDDRAVSVAESLAALPATG